MLPLLADFVHPNIHVAVVHFPIALLALGILAEPLAALLGAASLRSAARWMILLGALTSFPVALSGYHALQDLARNHEGAYTPWHEAVANSTLTPSQWSALILHTRLQSIASLAALLLAAFFLACSDRSRKALYLPTLLLLLTTAALTLYGSHIAGQTVYTEGTGVTLKEADNTPTPPESQKPNAESPSPNAEHLTPNAESPTPNAERQTPNAERQTPNAKHQTPTPHPATAESPTPSFSGWELRAAHFTPPLQLHLLIAGSALAFTLLSLAAAFRNANQLTAPAPTPFIAKSLRKTPAPEDTPPPPPTLLPASRLLLLATLLSLAAGSAGLWTLALESNTHAPRELWENILTFPPKELTLPAHADDLRRVTHLALGLPLFAVPLFLSLWSHLRPKSKLLLFLLTALWLAAATAQLGIGTLLLFDSPVGPLTHLTTQHSSDRTN